MQFSVASSSPEKQKSVCVAGIFESRRLTDAARALNEGSGRELQRLIRAYDVQGGIGETVMLNAVPNLPAQRVLLVGLGKKSELSPSAYARAVGAAAQALAGAGVREAAFFLAEVPVSGRDVYWKTRAIVEAARAAAYRFDQMKGEKPKDKKPALAKVLCAVTGRREVADAEAAVEHGVAIADGADLARDLGNLPGNVCTPSYLAERARELARGRRSMKVRVLGEAEMKRLGMGTLLSVARGSREPARLIVLEYRGPRAKGRPTALVGKGVTFDSGGISIKPAAAMDEMKYDMCGAASVLGVMRTVAGLSLPIHLVGIIPATENLLGDAASKPGDIWKSMSGQTVEVLNTDAEGRLILCDALTYARRYEPEVVVDIATLTGACVVALGNHASGLFSNDQKLADALLAAGELSGDRAWQLPLWEEYGEALKSNFADVANVGGREAGAITAAAFLARFAGDYHWAHLDIAGTAWRSGQQKGATGRPVALLAQFLLDRAGVRR